MVGLCVVHLPPPSWPIDLPLHCYSSYLVKFAAALSVLDFLHYGLDLFLLFDEVRFSDLELSLTLIYNQSWVTKNNWFVIPSSLTILRAIITASYSAMLLMALKASFTAYRSFMSIWDCKKFPIPAPRPRKLHLPKLFILLWLLQRTPKVPAVESSLPQSQLGLGPSFPF